MSVFYVVKTIFLFLIIKCGVLGSTKIKRHAILMETTPSTYVQKTAENIVIEVEPDAVQSTQLSGLIKSGPVVFLDTRTIFIPNLEYHGSSTDIKFVIGNGTPSQESIIIVKDMNGSQNKIHSNMKETLRLQLPDKYNLQNVDYFGVWLNESKNLEYVEIPTSQKHLIPQPKNGNTIILPKCCDSVEQGDTNLCSSYESNDQFDLSVHESNATHFNDEPVNPNNLSAVLYTYKSNCPKIALEEDEYYILMNGSLIYSIANTSVRGLLQQGDFCLHHSSKTWQIFVCQNIFTTQQIVHKAISKAYVALTAASLFCFVACAIFYLVVLTVASVHKKCFVAFAVSMTGTFICIICSQLVQQMACNPVGYAFEFFMISSYVWTLILNIDIYLQIRNSNERYQNFVMYLIVAVAISSIFTIISGFRGIPDIPNSFFKHRDVPCPFKEGIGLLVFYIPVGISLIISFIILILAKLKINNNDRVLEQDYYWLDNKMKYKFMFRQNVMTYVIMILFITAEIIKCYFQELNIIVMSVLQYSAGTLIGTVYLAHHINDKRVMRKRSNKKLYREMHEMRDLNETDITVAE